MASDTLLGLVRDWHWCVQSMVGMVHCVLARWRELSSSSSVSLSALVSLVLAVAISPFNITATSDRVSIVLSGDLQ